MLSILGRKKQTNLATGSEIDEKRRLCFGLTSESFLSPSKFKVVGLMCVIQMSGDLMLIDTHLKEAASQGSIQCNA